MSYTIPTATLRLADKITVIKKMQLLSTEAPATSLDVVVPGIVVLFLPWQPSTDSTPRSLNRKTTVVLFKMVAIERAWVQFGKDIALKPRQLFLTRSQHLADAVRESFARLHETYVVGDWSEESGNGLAFEAHDDVPRWSVTLPDSYEDLRPEHFPLFVSFDKASGTPAPLSYIRLIRFSAMQHARKCLSHFIV